ncbi:MAG: alpha/beta fold hydrolase [Candidatus Melainabacteria bacterium]|nr:alpha/beta fold hydrolase [Candidatus Melainabacteria bacterium]
MSRDTNSLSSTPIPPIIGVNGAQPQIPCEIRSIKSADGRELFCRFWKGQAGHPVIVYLHGIEGHSQWFENTASYLNGKGMTIYAADRRGAGLNPRDRGNLTSYKDFLADIETLVRKIGFDHMGHPIILMANCWGAKAATVMCAKDYKPVSADELTLPIAGLVMTSPAIFSKIDYDLGTKMQIAYNSLLGKGGRSDSKRKWSIPLEIDMFTDNPTFQGYLQRDPLRLTEATADFFVENYKLTKLAEKTASSIDLPVLLLQGGADRIVDLEKTQGYFARLKSPVKDMRIFPDSAHSLDFDANWFREYTHVLSEWIMAQCPVVR